MLKRPNDKEYIRPLWCFSLSRVSTQKNVSDSETKDALKFEVKSETSSPPNPNWLNLQNGPQTFVVLRLSLYLAP